MVKKDALKKQGYEERNNNKDKISPETPIEIKMQIKAPKLKVIKSDAAVINILDLNAMDEVVSVGEECRDRSINNVEQVTTMAKAFGPGSPLKPENLKIGPQYVAMKLVDNV